MFKTIFQTLAVLCLALTACAPVVQSPTIAAIPSDTATAAITFTSVPSETPSPTLPPTSTATETLTPVPTVESLKAAVAVNLLSCRYGPGADYLYFDGFREGLRVTLVGQTGGSAWVWVKGDKKNCWVNAKFLNVEGDIKTLPLVYPELAPLPVSPYFSPTTVLSATREGNTVTVVWLAVAVGRGFYEKEDMFIYIVEAWRCEGGQLIFDPIASNRETVSFIDEPGCDQPSHGRVFVQEKHGFAGPAEIPWP